MKRKTGRPGRAVLKKVLMQVISGITAFMLSTVRFTAGTMPFGLAFAGGVLPGYAVVSAAGAAAGYLFACGTLDALKHVSAAALICFIRLGVSELLTERKRKYLTTVFVVFSSAVSAVIVEASSGLTAAAVTLCLCEAVTAGAGCCFFSVTVGIPCSGLRSAPRKTAETAAAVLSAGAVLTAADGLTGGFVSVPHAAGAFLVMLLASSGKTASALLAGTGLGLLSGVSEGGERLMFALPACALLSDVSASYGKAACAAALAVSDLLTVLLGGGNDNALVFLCETFVCALVFLLLPKRVTDKVMEKLLPFCCEAAAEETDRALVSRLNAASRAVTAVGESVQAVTRIMKKNDVPGPDALWMHVKDTVCRDCAARESCWLRSGKVTENAFREANGRLTEKGMLAPEDLPERLGSFCPAGEELCRAFSREYCEYRAAVFARSEVFESKELAAMQFVNAGAVLAEAAAVVGDNFSDPRTAAAADGVLEEFGFVSEPSVAISDRKGRSTLSVFCSSVPRDADYESLTDRLYEQTGHYYLPPSEDCYKGLGTALNFCEAERFDAYAYAAVRKDPAEKYCGDACEIFRDGKGSFCVVLSDGMGRGSRAALDSVMTSSLTAKLLKAGFSADCTLNAVNAALMVKSDSETLSTLDILRLDLSTGEAEFLKAGASFSVVRTGGKTAVIEQSSLPLGILREPDPQRTRLKLSSGDRILVMSDGAAVLPHAAFREILTGMKNESCEAVAQHIADRAAASSPSGKNDDITVICVEIR